jgi:outer membrane lipoprotein-sorting protein
MFARILILIYVIGFGLTACAAAEQPMSPDLAQAIVADAWQADQHIVWELDWPAAPAGGPLTVETWRMNEDYRGDTYRGDTYRGDTYRGDTYRGDTYRGDTYRGDTYRGDTYRGDTYRGDTYRGDRYRYEILESVAPALVGETLVFNGQKAWQYNRFSTEAPVVPGWPWLSPVSDAFVMIDALIATPPQTATQEFAQIIHGPAQKITLTFDNGDHLILWRDEETQLPVKIVFSVDGKEATLNARDFEPLVDPPQGLFELENR